MQAPPGCRRPNKRPERRNPCPPWVNAAPGLPLAGYLVNGEKPLSGERAGSATAKGYRGFSAGLRPVARRGDQPRRRQDRSDRSELANERKAVEPGPVLDDAAIPQPAYGDSPDANLSATVRPRQHPSVGHAVVLGDLVDHFENEIVEEGTI